ncbi:MAG: hypothetical protein AAGA59_03260 [Actinomycetota bacterium]
MSDLGDPIDGDAVRRLADRVAAEVATAADHLLRLAWHGPEATAAREEVRRQRQEADDVAQAMRGVAADLDRREEADG